MSDIHDDLRRVETISPGSGRPPTKREAAERARTRELASTYLWKNAYDLYDMVMGEPVPHTGVAR